MATRGHKITQEGGGASSALDGEECQTRHERWWDVAILVCLVAIVIAVLWPVVTCDFVDYDDYQILRNPEIQQGLTFAGLRWAFTRTVGYWYPLTLLSHMLDCHLFGMNPVGHHATNLFLHACNTILLFLLLRNITGQRWCSVLVAALFALHPQNVETVAWVSGRRDLLSTSLGFLALLAYGYYTARPRISRYVAIAVLLTLSMMAKPAFMPFAVVLLFLDYWPLKRMEGMKLSHKDGRARFFRLLLEKVPLLMLVIGFAVSAYATQGRVGGLMSPVAFPLARRAPIAVVSYVMYAWKTAWPTRLTVCYPFPTLVWWQVTAAFTLLVAITAAAILGRKRFPYLFVGWFWYGLVLTPVIGVLAQISNAPRSDRYAYVPIIGLFIIAAWGLNALAQRRRQASIAVVAIAVTALLAGAATAHVQVRHWTNSVTLFRHAVAVTPDNYLAYSVLGKALKEAGRREEAASAFEEALRLSPHFVHAHQYFGSLLYEEGRYKEAIDHLAEAIHGDPTNHVALNDMGLVLLAQNKCDEAIACFRQAIAIEPEFALAHNNLGYALAGKGAFEEAIAEYQETLRLEPRFSFALYNLGDACLALERFDDAIQSYARAAEVEPGKRHEALNNIGRALACQGKLDEAIAQFRQAIAAKPDFAPAHSNLGHELALKGAFSEAIAECREALRIEPEFALALDNLGNALASSGQSEEAIDSFRKAIRLDPNDDLAYTGLAVVLLGQGRLEDASAFYQKALRIAPTNADAANGLAQVLIRQGRVDDGMMVLRKATEIAPRSASARVNYGRALSAKRLYAEACVQFEEALKAEPQNTEARRGLETAKAAAQTPGP